MTIGSVGFFKMRGSLSSGEYPLLNAGQPLTPFHLHTATVKYEKGLQTRVVVPFFTEWETANVAQIDGSFYWITQSKESTAHNGSAEMILDYMGPTSLFRYNDTVKGRFHKTATNECPYLKQEITNGIMGIESSVAFSALDCPASQGTEVMAYWVQITGHKSDGTVKRFGFFLPYNRVKKEISIYENVYADMPSEPPYKRYPSFYDLCTDMSTLTGLTAEQIDDVSISKRCPYKVESRESTWTGTYGKIYQLRITANNGTPVDPNFPGAGSYMYDIEALYSVNTIPDTNTQTLTLSLSDRQRAISNISIMDWNRNSVMMIPTNRGATITIDAEVHADLSGIYTIIKAYDSQITIPEGKLPYFGNTFATYKAFQMDADRTAMEFALENARYNKETSTVVSMANTASSALSGVTMGALTGNLTTALTGLIGGATSGAIGFYENDRAYDLAVMNAKQAEELSRKQAVNQPSSGYNVAYGLIYCYLNEKSALIAAIESPTNATDAYYESWCEENGYPAEGSRTVRIIEGFYKGMLLSESSEQSGMYWDECNKVFMRGFKFVSPS